MLLWFWAPCGSRVTTVTTFSRQNDAVYARVLRSEWENLVLVVLVVLESKGI